MSNEDDRTTPKSAVADGPQQRRPSTSFRGAEAERDARTRKTDPGANKAVGKVDGRRNNRGPESGQIKPKEIRNPYGRGGKPKTTAVSQLDEAYIELAATIVSRDRDDRPIFAMERLLKADLHAALASGDTKAIERTLAGMRMASAAQAKENAKRIEGALAYRFEMEDRFRRFERARCLAPDQLPHPAHVAIENGEVVINGPCTRPMREWWECLKANITITAHRHTFYRKMALLDPGSVWEKGLKDVEVLRRKCMRQVPKGWNYKEAIYTRDSRRGQIDDAIKQLDEIHNLIWEEANYDGSDDDAEA